MTSLHAAKLRQNALPNVLPHQRSEKLCDELSAEGERNVAVRLPVFAASKSTGVIPPGVVGKFVDLDELQLPTEAQLEKHRQKFAPRVAHLRRDHDAVVKLTGEVLGVYAKWHKKAVKPPRPKSLRTRKKAVLSTGDDRG
jgi:hypothetical protein